MAENKMPEKIGTFLVSIGAMKPWQLEGVLVLQEYGDTRIFGEIAISLGYIDDAALAKWVASRSISNTTDDTIVT